MDCPVCGGPCWDNRGNKRNPKSPDFKCKNRECGKGVWEQQRGGQPQAQQGGNGAPRPAPAYTWNALAATYRRCWKIAENIIGKGSPDQQAATATLFIQASKMGMTVAEAPKPPPPPPPPDEYNEGEFQSDDGDPY